MVLWRSVKTPMLAGVSRFRTPPFRRSVLFGCHGPGAPWLVAGIMAPEPPWRDVEIQRRGYDDHRDTRLEPEEGLRQRGDDEMTEYECTIDAKQLKTLEGHPDLKPGLTSLEIVNGPLLENVDGLANLTSLTSLDLRPSTF